jgi:hypothetical protein
MLFFAFDNFENSRICGVLCANHPVVELYMLPMASCLLAEAIRMHTLQLLQEDEGLICR